MSNRSLETTNKELLPKLGRAVWSWHICHGCNSDQSCIDSNCPARDLSHLQPYFQFYQSVVSTYVENAPENRVLQNHEDLWRIIELLRSKPDATMGDLWESIVPGYLQKATRTNRDDLQSAVALAVRVLTMINCSALHHSSDRLEKGTCRLDWKQDVAFTKYLQDLFPTCDDPIFSRPGNDAFAERKFQLRATNICNHLGVALCRTSDIRDHLRLNRKQDQDTLEIYHHTAFLKEQLKLTKHMSLGDNSVTPMRTYVKAMLSMPCYQFCCQ
jgi:hypothetical protein